MQKYLWLVLLLSFFHCADSMLEKELKTTKAQLIEAKAALDLAQKALAEGPMNNQGQLTHLVFFKVKPTANLDTLIQEIKTLATIEILQDLEVGPYKDLGDTRALSDYDLLMQMKFNNIDDYKTYQVHPLHKALQTNIGYLLAGPPATYDFINK